jgi:hypothetical protein
VLYYAALGNVPCYDSTGARIVPLWYYREGFKDQPPQSRNLRRLLDYLPLASKILEGEERLAYDEARDILRRFVMFD